jgi:hypothetical protein
MFSGLAGQGVAVASQAGASMAADLPCPCPGDCDRDCSKSPVASCHASCLGSMAATLPETPVQILLAPRQLQTPFGDWHFVTRSAAPPDRPPRLSILA